MSFKDGQESTLLKVLHEEEATLNREQTYYNAHGDQIVAVTHTFPIYYHGEVIAAAELARNVTSTKEHVHTRGQTGTARYQFEDIIGTSDVMKQAVQRAKQVAQSDLPVLITGETGTGKELFAQSIHAASSRAEAPFIAENCAAIPESLMESLLFGSKKGAFTGATDRPGLLEQVKFGTLLLDELQSLNPMLQAKLLRAIQERVFRRVGDTVERPFNGRILSTMNESPEHAMQAGTLRPDLYYRLAAIQLHIPPLRERPSDIEPLLQHFITKSAPHATYDPRLARQLQAYPFPGNVRELAHGVEAGLLFAGNAPLALTHFPSHIAQGNQQKSAATLKDIVARAEQKAITTALRTHDGNITKAAKSLGVSRQSLQYRLKERP
ncbi:sigma 54-interacting transcriptional regulator [Bacillus sp. FSL W7-1360]